MKKLPFCILLLASLSAMPCKADSWKFDYNNYTFDIQPDKPANLDFNVWCQVKTKKTADESQSWKYLTDSTQFNDRCSKEKEKITWLLNAIYHTMPPAYQKAARTFPFVVNHASPYTTSALGWSAEDDEEYKYPNQLPANDNNPSGIKINLGERSLALLEFAMKELPNKNRPAYMGILKYSGLTIIHELMHAIQYSEKPTCEFEFAQNYDELGEFPKADTLDGLALKIETYELYSTSLDKEVMSKDPACYQAASDAIKLEYEENPKPFEKGAIYYTLSPAFDGYTIIQSLEDKIKEADIKGFTPTEIIFYQGQVELPRILIQTNEIYRALTGKPLNKNIVTKLEEISDKLNAKFQSYFITEAQQREADKLTGDDKKKKIAQYNKMWENGLREFPHLNKVIDRYQKERERLKNYFNEFRNNK